MKLVRDLKRRQIHQENWVKNGTIIIVKSNTQTITETQFLKDENME